MLYIKDYNGKNVRDLLEYFFFPMTKTTFKNDLFTKVDHYSGTRRSLEAIVDLVNTYYPDTSEKEVLKIMREINRSGGVIGRFIYGHYCNNVGGAVFSTYTPDDGENIQKHRYLISGYNYYNFLGWRRKEVNAMKKDDHKSIDDIRKILRNIR